LEDLAAFIFREKSSLEAARRSRMVVSSHITVRCKNLQNHDPNFCSGVIVIDNVG
jgi:hypothetical protein